MYGCISWIRKEPHFISPKKIIDESMSRWGTRALPANLPSISCSLRGISPQPSEPDWTAASYGLQRGDDQGCQQRRAWLVGPNRWGAFFLEIQRNSFRRKWLGAAESVPLDASNSHQHPYHQLSSRGCQFYYDVLANPDGTRVPSLVSACWASLVTSAVFHTAGAHQAAVHCGSDSSLCCGGGMPPKKKSQSPEICIPVDWRNIYWLYVDYVGCWNRFLSCRFLCNWCVRFWNPPLCSVHLLSTPYISMPCKSWAPLRTCWRDCPVLRDKCLGTWTEPVPQLWNAMFQSFSGSWDPSKADVQCYIP